MSVASVVARVDGPTDSCEFESHRCSAMVRGHGGFQRHHRWPLSMGGPADGPQIVCCDNHHMRQHSLIRYLVETLDLKAADWAVLKHFSPAERQAAADAVSAWVAAGRPMISGWPCPAARA